MVKIQSADMGNKTGFPRSDHIIMCNLLWFLAFRYIICILTSSVPVGFVVLSIQYKIENNT